MGDSRSSLLFLLISCVVNVVLDIIFVAVLEMNVAGAALATILAMFASWFFSIVYIRKKYPELNLPMISFHLNKKILRDILVVGLPLGLNNSIYVDLRGIQWNDLFCKWNGRGEISNHR